MFAVIGAATGLAGRRVLRAVGADVPPPCCELAALLLWAAVGWRWLSGGWAVWWLPVPLAVTAFAVPLVFADLRHLRLPTVLTLAAYPVVAAAIGVAAGVVGAPLALRAGLGGLAFAGTHALVRLLNPAALGAGDVKLAGSVGAVLAAVGWAALPVGACLAALITVAFSVLRLVSAIAADRRSRWWRTGVPYGPGLLVATWLIAVFPGTAVGAGTNG